jgi:hypothetical protein
MKKILLAINLFFLLLITHNSNGQPGSPPPVALPSIGARQQVENLNGDNQHYSRNDINLESSTIIKGDRVFGTPFLYDEWMDGTIVTADGRTYYYKTRYNVYENDQVVSYMYGKDSMDVNEEIKGFSLQVPVYADSTRSIQFVSAGQYQHEKSTFYYEVVLDNEKGQLLRVNKKVITTADNAAFSSVGKKIFTLEPVFYYFNKSTKKIYKIRLDGSNVGELLNLDKNKQGNISTENYDFNKGRDIISFFTLYFQQTPKAF